MTDRTLPIAVASVLDDPPPGERLTVDAAGIAYSALAWGDPAGRPLLLLHGVTSSAGNWWRVGPALAATGRRVVAPDLPGHGLTGDWRGQIRFRDNAAGLIAFAENAGISSDDLQVVGHSWGAVTAAAFPVAGLRPATIVLVDPPALPFALIAQKATDPTEHGYDDVDEAIEAVRAQNPGWSDGDIRHKAEALTQVDEIAARAVVLDNGDWDGGIADLEDPAADGLDIWVVRGDPDAGGYLPDAWIPRFAARIGADHILTIKGAPHSPMRTHPVETTADILRALEED